MKSPDTDIFFLLLHYAEQLHGTTILFDTGKGNQKRLIDMSSLAQAFTQQHCTALLACHAFTGCDTTSAFKGKGKVRPIQLMQKNPSFIEAFASLGDSWQVPEHLLVNLEEFTCLVYNRKSVKAVDELRYILLKEKCGDEEMNPKLNVDLSTLPPCRRSPTQHVRRVNYQVAIWKRAHDPHPALPNAAEGHGWEQKEGYLQPLWTADEDELILPDSVVKDLQQEQMDTDEEVDPEVEDLDTFFSNIEAEDDFDFDWDDYSYEDC